MITSDPNFIDPTNSYLYEDPTHQEAWGLRNASKLAALTADQIENNTIGNGNDPHPEDPNDPSNPDNDPMVSAALPYIDELNMNTQTTNQRRNMILVLAYYLIGAAVYLSFAGPTGFVDPYLDEDNDSLFLAFIDALYFSSSTLTSTGFGDLHPTSEPLRLFTVFYMLAGVGVVGVIVIDSVSGILEDCVLDALGEDDLRMWAAEISAASDPNSTSHDIVDHLHEVTDAVGLTEAIETEQEILDLKELDSHENFPSLPANVRKSLSYSQPQVFSRPSFASLNLSGSNESVARSLSAAQNQSTANSKRSFFQGQRSFTGNSNVSLGPSSSQEQLYPFKNGTSLSKDTVSLTKSKEKLLRKSLSRSLSRGFSGSNLSQSLAATNTLLLDHLRKAQNMTGSQRSQSNSDLELVIQDADNLS